LGHGFQDEMRLEKLQNVSFWHHSTRSGNWRLDASGVKI
jgi:hypothetical protein